MKICSFIILLMFTFMVGLGQAQPDVASDSGVTPDQTQMEEPKSNTDTDSQVRELIEKGVIQNEYEDTNRNPVYQDSINYNQGSNKLFQSHRPSIN